MNKIYEDFIDNAVTQGVAPGLQATIFTKDSFIFNGASGLAKTAGEDSKEVEMEKKTALALFSASKLTVSLVVLRILEQGLSKIPFSLTDLDDHEKLVSVLPAIKLGGGNMVTKILEGFGSVLGSDGKKELKLRDAKKGCTLRDLLTHTNGQSYPWNQPSHFELFQPTEGEPHFPNIVSTEIKDFSFPLKYEPGERYTYGVGADWLGQFAIRSTGSNLRELCKDLIFKPLSLNEDEVDLLPVKKNASIHVRGDQKGSFVAIPFDAYKPQDDWNPEEGKAWAASGPQISSLQAHSKILQAVLSHDPRLLTEETWKLAVSDQTTEKGIKIEIPTWKASVPQFSHDIDEFSAQIQPGDFGINLLQAPVFNSPTVSGMAKGSHAWAGLANVFWFLDPVAGIGSMLGTQLLPFYDPQMVKLRDEWEKLIYSQLEGNKTASDSEVQASRASL